MPTGDWALEGFKAAMQGASVTLGVWLGWWLNGQSQRLARVSELHAVWGAAAEKCLGALTVAAKRLDAIADEDARNAEMLRRHRDVEKSRTALRVATVRVLILAKDRPVRQMVTIGDEIDDVVVQMNESRVGPGLVAILKARGLRERIRSVVQTWEVRGPWWNWWRRLSELANDDPAPPGLSPPPS
jgi:hypothetical protein